MRRNLAREVDLIGMAVLERTSDILFIDGTVEFENSSPLLLTYNYYGNRRHSTIINIIHSYLVILS
jgi:hypothetical protein